MAGPWEKYQQPSQPSQSDGPWSKYKNPSPPEPEQEKKNSGSMSAVRNFLQGATANFSDEIAGGVEAAGRIAGLKGLGAGDIRDISLAEGGATFDPQKIKQAYLQARDQERADIKKDAIDNPKISFASNVAGAVTSPINKVIGGASLAKAGAAYGGLAGLGGSEEDSFSGMAKDSALGAATGAAVGKGIEKASPYISKAITSLAKKASDLAEKFAARGVGAERGTFNKIGAKGIKEVGRQALNKDILSGNTEKMISKNNALKQSAMDVRAKAYGLIDEVAGPTFSPLNVAAKVEEAVLGGRNRAHADVQETIKILEPHLQNILSRGENNITLTEAQKLVSALGKKAKFDVSRSNEANEVAKKVYGVVRDAINQSADDGASLIGAKGIKKAIQKSNKMFSVAKDTKELLANKLAREQGNKLIGLTDLGATATAAAASGGPAAIATLAGKKVLEKWGSMGAAKTLNSIANHISAKPALSALAKANPAITERIALMLRKPGATRAVGSAQDGDTAIASIKGEDKWAIDGLEKIASADPSAIDNESLFNSKKGKSLLVQASATKPGTKAMDAIIKKIKEESRGGGASN